MSKQIRVLIIEDSEDDTLMNVRELEKHGYEVRSRRVETASSMEAALDGEVWDVILSDYRMPAFSAPAALELMQEKGLSIPFIVISGTVGEDTAVEVMKAGAHDFFTKANMSRLVPAIEREMQDAEHRRKRKEAEKRHSILFEKAAEGIMGADIETKKLMFANPAMCDLLGYTEEEMKGLSVQDIHPGEAVGHVLSEFEAQARGEKTLAMDLPFLRKDGEVFYGDVNTAKVELEGKHYNVAFVTDTTERKIREDKIRHFNRVLRAIRGVNQLITRERDPDKLITDACRHLMRTGGYLKVWIALFDEKGGLKAFAGDEVEKEFPRIKKALEEGKRHRCQEMALERGRTVVVKNVESVCAGCPMAKDYGEKVVFCVPLAYGGKTYGTMSVALSKDLAIDPEEQGLFEELAGDISFALFGIETGEESKRMQEERENHLHELEVFYESATGREERILELKKEIKDLRKKLGEKGR